MYITERILFELKYLLRRFGYDLPQQLKDELFDFLQQYPISAIAICEVINRYIEKQETALNFIRRIKKQAAGDLQLQQAIF